MENNIYILLTVFTPIFASVIMLLLARVNRAQRWLGLGASILTWGFSIVVLLMVINEGPQTYRLGGYTPPYGIVFIADMLSALFGVMATTVMMAGFMYNVHSKEKAVGYPTFIPLFAVMATGLNGSFYTGDLFTFFVFLELMVLSSVAMVAMSDNRYGLEAAIKYVFISGMGTLFLLIGIAAMYTTFGTLNLAHMAVLLAEGERELLARSAAVMLMSAFLLKSAVFPFHFWQPDFHTTAPTAVSAMLSSVIVKVGIYMIIRTLTLLFTVEAPQIQNLLVILGIIGIFFGSLAALRTYNGKRVLAYSTIGQVGFILVAIGWANLQPEAGVAPLALTAAIIYAFNHAFIKSSLLMIMGLVAGQSHEHSVDFVDIDGLGPKLPPIIGMLWFLGGMSLAGLPPLNGFISKFAVARAGVGFGEWLALGLVIGSGALTLTYMFRTWQRVFQTKGEVKLHLLEKGEKGDGWLAPAFLITICILLGIYARPLVVLAEQTAIQILDVSIYIEAINLFGG
ncbi:MAG: proton-conducting transporter membrane subunit [Chloroflexota bacterium]